MFTYSVQVLIFISVQPTYFIWFSWCVFECWYIIIRWFVKTKPSFENSKTNCSQSIHHNNKTKQNWKYALVTL